MAIKEINYDPNSDWGVISADVLKVSDKPNPRVWIEDNFY